jgi:hypothetical protein
MAGAAEIRQSVKESRRGRRYCRRRREDRSPCHWETIRSCGKMSEEEMNETALFVTPDPLSAPFAKIRFIAQNYSVQYHGSPCRC